MTSEKTRPRGAGQFLKGRYEQRVAALADKGIIHGTRHMSIDNRTDVTDVRALRATWRYRMLRDRFIAENPLCAECERQGRVRRSKELDHVIPAEKRPDLFWDEQNWQALCRPCHHKKTGDENRVENPILDARRARFERVRQELSRGC